MAPDCADFLTTCGLPDILPITDCFPCEQHLTIGSRDLRWDRWSTADSFVCNTTKYGQTTRA